MYSYESLFTSPIYYLLELVRFLYRDFADGDLFYFKYLRVFRVRLRVDEEKRSIGLTDRTNDINNDSTPV